MKSRLEWEAYLSPQACNSLSLCAVHTNILRPAQPAHNSGFLLPGSGPPMVRAGRPDLFRLCRSAALRLHHCFYCFCYRSGDSDDKYIVKYIFWKGLLVRTAVGTRRIFQNLFGICLQFLGIVFAFLVICSTCLHSNERQKGSSFRRASERGIRRPLQSCVVWLVVQVSEPFARPTAVF